MSPRPDFGGNYTCGRKERQRECVEKSWADFRFVVGQPCRLHDAGDTPALMPGAPHSNAAFPHMGCLPARECWDGWDRWDGFFVATCHTACHGIVKRGRKLSRLRCEVGSPKDEDGFRYQRGADEPCEDGRAMRRLPSYVRGVEKRE